MTKHTIRLATDFTLPAHEAVCQTFGVLAVRGAGKSNTAAVMAEGMYDAGCPFVVIDPVGSWHGLRADGENSKGLSIPIFGGRHGDVPLERTGGQLIADLVVDQRLTCVLDVSEFSEGDKIRFLIDFAERLYRRNTQPLHLFLEEADDFIPQRPFREQARLLGAWENIVRRGRARGLGITMITQRSASLNKNVLTQIETLIVLRTTSPQDRAAVEAWVKYQGGSADMLATLPKLESGEAWVWSPSWLKTFKRIQVLRRRTYDSGATPTAKFKAARTLAEVDLESIRDRMADTIERSKQTDPKHLRAELAEAHKLIAELQRQNEKKQEPVFDPNVLSEIEHELRNTVERVKGLCVKAREATFRSLPNFKHVSGPAFGVDIRTRDPKPLLPKSLRATVSAESRSPNGVLGKGERLVLVAIAQAGDAGLTHEQLAVFTGYKSRSRETYVQLLKSKGYVERQGSTFVVTQAGVDELGTDFERLPTGSALRKYWLERLPAGERRIFEVLVDAYPNAVDPETIERKTDYKTRSRETYIQKLKARRLVERVGREFVASKELFGR